MIQNLKKIYFKTLWRLFYLFEKLNTHVLPVHFYSPIPDTRSLQKNNHLFEVEHPMYGIDMRDQEQLIFLDKIVKPFEEEYIRNGGDQFGVNESKMPSFAPSNALTLYAAIRYFKPKRMIEVGSGKSTQISSSAFLQNQLEGHEGKFTAIEPFPSAELEKGYKGLNSLIKKKVEDVSIELFKELKANDILFIDSSHTVKIFGDVNYLYLTVLPQLAPGVIIHIHDIFFPVDYLPHHFFNKGLKQFWQEQYLLHAFLMFNHEYEILFCSSYVHYKYKNKLKEIFPWYHLRRWPSSFWMRRKI